MWDARWWGWEGWGGRAPMLNDEAERTVLFLCVWGHPAPAFQWGAQGLCTSRSLARSRPAVLPAPPLLAAIMAASLPHIPWVQGQQADAKLARQYPG